MLCPFCEKVLAQDPPEKWRIKHHLSYSDLANSAGEGCKLCKVFKRVLLEEYSAKLACSLEEAGQSQLRVDDENSSKEEAQRLRFFVEPWHEDLDTRSAPCEHGLKSLLFIRQIDQYQTPPDEAYPHVSVCVSSEKMSISGIIGRKIGADPDISLGRGWIDNCLENHTTTCVQSGTSQLPTRIIKVGSTDGNEEPRLIQSEGQEGVYLTLSHCWGGSIPVQTTSSTCEKHLNGLPFESLPKTFQDAITVTRTLRVPFLWIDSLCILQDSKEDWVHECKKMPGTYRNSLATIAGPAAANCEAGFLDRRPVADRAWVDVRWQLNKSNTYCDVTLQSISHGNFFVEPEVDSALSKRAWVLQERLLSPRVLYFGTERMYWECCVDQRYEDMHYSATGGSSGWGGVDKTSFALAKDRLWWLSYWYHVVEAYTEAALTFHTDKFPALSALVSIIQPKLDDIYVAGLWKKDLCRGLAWYSRVYDLDETILHAHDRYVAPSWSWASARKPVRLPNIFKEDPNEETAQVVDVVLESAGATSLGQLGGGHVEICGMVAFGIIRIRSDVLGPGKRMIYFFDAGPETDILGTFYPDNPKLSATFPDRNPDPAEAEDLFSLRREILILHLRTNALKSGTLVWTAMAVEPLGSDWRRIGLVSGRFDKFPAARSFLDKSHRRTIKIF